jgi:hypothetical protein
LAVASTLPAPSHYNAVPLHKYKVAKKKVYIEEGSTGRTEPIVKDNPVDYGETIKAYKFAYEKNNYSFSPPKAKRVSIAVEEALKHLATPALGSYDVEKGLKKISHMPASSITARRR